MLSPIVLFVYNRPEHTRKTLESLEKNDLSKESELFIYADGPKEGASNEGLEKIKKTREILREKQWCKDVHIIERDKNMGLANSVIAGVTEIINKFGKIIVLEDDLILSKAFLSYMNNLLDYYEKEKKIFGITGYNHPQELMKMPDNYKNDIYFNPRIGSWSWATWNDRWIQADWKVSDYDSFKNNGKMRKLFNRGGDDISDMLDLQMKGKIDSWAIRWCYSVFKSKGLYVYPAVSYIDNIGMDGSGTHCSKSIKNMYKNNILNKKKNLELPKRIEIDERIMKNFRKIYKKDIKRLIFDLIIKTNMYNYFKGVNNKL